MPELLLSEHLMSALLLSEHFNVCCLKAEILSADVVSDRLLSERADLKPNKISEWADKSSVCISSGR